MISTKNVSFLYTTIVLLCCCFREAYALLSFPSLRLQNQIQEDVTSLCHRQQHHDRAYRVRYHSLFGANSNVDDNTIRGNGATISPKLTVIIPAYNEFHRIEDTIATYRAYLTMSPLWKKNSSILVVDDGSVDHTARLVQNIAKKNSRQDVKISCLSMKNNQGKGAAVTCGISYLVQQQSKTATAKLEEEQLVLIADADASADIASLSNMLHTLYNGSHETRKEEKKKRCTMVVGNRSYPQQNRSIKRSILRWGFKTAVRVICGNLGVNDSQCGFKLITLHAAELLYRDLNIKGWSHDVEVLYRARGLKLLVREQPIPWEDKAGSKLITSAASVILMSIKMLMEVAIVRLQYITGRWKLPEREKSDGL